MMDKFIGKRLDGRYEIETVIGIGGMSVVYKARDLVTGYPVAVKILKEEYLQNEEFCRRFRNESKAIAVLSHKNIVKVFDVGDAEPLQYIVMEYIDGITLKEYIEQQGVLTWKESVHFTTQILRALQHAHEKGIVHRDIKPQNIMLLQNGEIKVTDFGIARFSRSETRTMTEKAIGSVHYIAPEQARGGKTDARSDIYSVGVMLYEMLTGQLPFEAENAVSVAVMQLQADPKMPRKINPDIPRGLEEITMQAMQKDPSNRYQSAYDMLADLDDFKANPNIRFEYRYYVDDSNNRYKDAIQSARAQLEDAEEPKSPIIPVIAGIASAFVLVFLVFMLVALDINNMFADRNEQVSLPDFRGMNYNEIISDPQYLFQFQLNEVFDPTIPEGIVIEQNPKSNKNVYVDTIVKLTVSKGPERLMVPDFKGKEFSEYSKEVMDLGLTYIKYDVYDEDTEEGGIINTNPMPRTTVKEGDSIEIYVSLGAKTDTLTMPNCINMSFDDANSRLTGMGMKVAQPTEAESDKPKGTVIAQDPTYGTPLEEGQTIKFTISNGKAPTKEARLVVRLPANVDQMLPLEIYLGDVKVRGVTVNPVANPEFSITLTGTGVKTATVYINGSKYQDYSIDFDSGTATLTRDYGFKVPTTKPTTTAPTTAEPTAPPTDPTAEPEPAATE
ncbi:MAG: Stk1 family PASTA domain-containing Ser/Thr kinase [Oscillospiraceae bacterium]|jgi:serine/threonine-protein kinase|nr:Stk1 family PASTA domain-containing Ser/Thr kinase [Oscillospiraceae bacterium]